jgi:hypothetical protein
MYFEQTSDKTHEMAPKTNAAISLIRCIFKCSNFSWRQEIMIKVDERAIVLVVALSSRFAII